jgi:hypothetical protein
VYAQTDQITAMLLLAVLVSTTYREVLLLLFGICLHVCMFVHVLSQGHTAASSSKA